MQTVSLTAPGRPAVDDSNPLRLNISPKVNADGNHVVRWCEDMSWGVATYLITVAKPYGLERARRDFDLFCSVPADKRREAADAVRTTMAPTDEILAAFISRKEERVLVQSSLF